MLINLILLTNKTKIIIKKNLNKQSNKTQKTLKDEIK